MKNTISLIVFTFLISTTLKANLYLDTNLYLFNDYLDVEQNFHTHKIDNKYLIYGIGTRYLNPEKAETNHIITEIEFDKNNCKVKINSANVIESQFNPIFNRYTKFTYNEENDEISIVQPIPIKSSLAYAIIHQTLPIRERIKNNKVISTDCDSSFENIKTKDHNAPIIYNEDGTMSLYCFQKNKAKDTLGIFIINYDKDFKYKNYEYIAPPSKEEFRSLSGLDFSNNTLFLPIKEVIKTTEGTLIKFYFFYKYKVDGIEYGKDVYGLMFLDKNNKLVYVKTPFNLINNEEHLINNIIEYQDKFIITTNNISKSSPIFSNNLIFIDKTTGEVLENKPFGLKKLFYVNNFMITPDSLLFLVGHFGAIEPKDYKAALSIYDLKNKYFSTNSNPGLLYDRSTIFQNIIDLGDSSYYFYGASINNFFGCLYTLKNSSVNISYNDNISLNVRGDLNHISITTEFNEIIPTETNIQVYDITGRCVHSGLYSISSGKKLDIYNSEFKNGAYIIKISNKYFNISQKIVI